MNSFGKKRLSALALAISVIALAGAAHAADLRDPATSAVRQLVESIRKLRTTTNSSQRAALIDTIDRSLAIEPLCKRALGDEWGRHDAKEHAHFVSLIKQSLERFAYPRAAEFFADLSITYAGEDVSARIRIVHTTVAQRKGGAVSIDYHLKRIGTRWIVTDIDLDRQSLAANVEGQVQAVLKKSSYSGLVEQLESGLKSPG